MSFKFSREMDTVVVRGGGVVVEVEIVVVVVAAAAVAAAVLVKVVAEVTFIITLSLKWMNAILTNWRLSTTFSDGMCTYIHIRFAQGWIPNAENDILGSSNWQQWNIRSPSFHHNQSTVNLNPLKIKSVITIYLVNLSLNLCFTWSCRKAHGNKTTHVTRFPKLIIITKKMKRSVQDLFSQSTHFATNCLQTHTHMAMMQHENLV